MPDQQPTEERRQNATRAELEALGHRVDRIESVVWGVEALRLKGMLGRMDAMEGGIIAIGEKLERQELDRKAELDLLRQTLTQHEKERKAERDKMIFGIQMLLAGMGLQGGALIGRFLGWW